MAEPDGSIIVDTQIDSEGFKKGTQKLKNAVQSLIGSIKSVGNAKPKLNTSSAEQNIDELKEKIRQLEQEISLYEKNANLPQFKNSDAYQNKISALKDDLAEAQDTLRALEYDSNSSNVGASATFADKKFRKLSASADEAGNSASRASTKTNRFGKIAASVAKKGLSKMVSGLKKAASHFNLFNRGSKGSENAVKSLTKKLTGLWGMFKRMLTRKLFMAIIQGVKDGINNLAQYSDETNKNLSALKSGLTLLKNSLATAFAPILDVITPILTQFISSLSEAISKVGQFFAALTGKTTFTKAVAVQEDYAASLDKTAKSSDKATKAAKKYGDTLDIDEVHDIQSINDTNDTSDSGTSVNDMFEDVQVESKIAEFAKKLKDAIKKGDLSSIGKDFAEQMNKNTAKVQKSIKKFKEKAIKAAEGLATFFNGFTEEFDWANAGNTVADGINLIFEPIEAFFANLHWQSYSTAFTDFIKGILENVNWQSIQNSATNLGFGIATFLNGVFGDKTMWNDVGMTFGNGVNTVLDFLYTTVHTFNFASAGQSISMSLNSAINIINWDELGKLLKEGFGGVLDFLSSAVSTLEWGQIGHIISGLLIDTITPDENGETIVGKITRLLSDVIKAALDLLIGLIEGLEKQDLVDKTGDLIWEILSHVDWVDIMEKVAKLALHSAMLAIRNLFFNLLPDSEKWIKLADTMEDVFDKLSEYINPKAKSKGEELGNFFIEGYNKALKGSSVPKETAEVGKQATIMLCKALGINSPSTVAFSLGIYYMLGFINGIKAYMSNLESNCKNVASTAITSLGNLGSKAWNWGVDVVKNLADGIINNIHLVGNAVTKVADKIKAIIGFSEPDEGPLSRFHTFMPDMLKLMADGIYQNKGIALEAVSSLADDVSKQISNGDFTFSSIGFESDVDIALDSFSDRITSGFTNLLDTLQAIADSVTFTVPNVATHLMPYSVTTGSPKGGFPNTDEDDFFEKMESILKDFLLSLLSSKGNQLPENVTFVGELIVDGVNLGEVMAKPVFDAANRRKLQLITK